METVMSIAQSLPRLHSPFLFSHRAKLLFFSHSLKSSCNGSRGRRRQAELLTTTTTTTTTYPCIRALDLDQNTVVAISVGVLSVAVGVGIPIFYETQIDSAAKRDNKQPCFPCNGSGAQQCRFCTGTGNVTVVLGAGETEVSKCINCEGAGSLTCTTCQGTGIQPRYLDRREFKDDD